MKLNKTIVDSLEFKGSNPKAKCIFWDDEVPGFGVRVWPSGKKTFLLAYRYAGRQRYLTLGAYGTLTPHQAREMAVVKRADVYRGFDPLAEKQKILRGETMADLCDAYLKRHADPRKKSAKKDADYIKRYIRPAWGTLKVKGLRHADVARLHHKIGVDEKHPTTANRVAALVSVMMSKAKRWGYLDEGADNPASGIERFREVKRERFVTPAEMPKLAKSIDDEGNIYLKALVWLYLFTGLRKDELRTLRWDQIDWARSAIRLEADETKSKRSHEVPISSGARFLLENLPRVVRNPYVFPGQKEGRPIVNVAKPWNRIRKRAGIEDVRIHDLRRTVGSWLAQSGSSDALIGRVLNHASVQTTRIYTRFHLDPIAEVLEEHSKMIRQASLHKVDARDAHDAPPLDVAASDVD